MSVFCGVRRTWRMIALGLALGLAGCADQQPEQAIEQAQEPVAQNEEPAADQAGEPEAKSPIEGYRLVWADEFDGDKVNEEAWLHRTSTQDDVSICLPRNVSLEDGAMKIALKKEQYEGFSYTNGGLITRDYYRYGYYEVAAKMDKGNGWHEAFWTTWFNSFDRSTWPEDWEEMGGRIEIDVFEHYATYDSHKFTYGIIEWAPLKGNINRDYVTTEADLSEDFHTFAFEFTPEYFNFFFDGEILKTLSMEGVPQNKFALWLTCIATQPPDEEGASYFDYLRCYEPQVDSEAYQKRRAHFLKVLEEQKGTVSSSGRDLWIQAEDFEKKGGWSVARDEGQMILVGHQEKPVDPTPSDLAARTMVIVRNPGQYRLWVRARDYKENLPGARNFQVAINGLLAEGKFGDHGQEGYAWEDGGLFDLVDGYNTIELYDSSLFWPRCDKLLFTSDLEFLPEGLGGSSNVEHWWEQDQLKTAFPE